MTQSRSSFLLSLVAAPFAAKALVAHAVSPPKKTWLYSANPVVEEFCKLWMADIDAKHEASIAAFRPHLVKLEWEVNPEDEGYTVWGFHDRPDGTRTMLSVCNLLRGSSTVNLCSWTPYYRYSVVAQSPRPHEIPFTSTPHTVTAA